MEGTGAGGKQSAQSLVSERIGVAVRAVQPKFVGAGLDSITHRARLSQTLSLLHSLPLWHALWSSSLSCALSAMPVTRFPSHSPHYHLSLALSSLSPLPRNLATLGLTSPSRSPPLICAEGENTLGLTQIDLEKFLRMADEQSAAEKVTRRSPISHPTLCHSKLLWLPITAADDAGVR